MTVVDVTNSLKLVYGAFEYAAFNVQRNTNTRVLVTNYPILLVGGTRKALTIILCARHVVYHQRSVRAS